MIYRHSFQATKVISFPRLAINNTEHERDNEIMLLKKIVIIDHLLLPFGQSTFGLMEPVPQRKQLQQQPHVFCKIKYIITLKFKLETV